MIYLNYGYPIDTDRDLFRMSGAGILLPAEYLMEKPRPRKPKAMDLFSGCGGMSLGIIKAGFDVVAALEIDPTAIVTYLMNLGAYPVKMIFIEDSDRKRMEKHLDKYFRKVMASRPDVIDVEDLYRCSECMSGANRHMAAPDFDGVQYMFIGDVRKLTGEFILETIGMEVGELDLVCGGPPCQGFSRAGKQNVMDPRNSLVFEFAKLVTELQPKTVCFENVPGIVDMVTPEGIPVMDAVCKILEDGNYGDYDALKKCITGTAGLGAAVRNGRGTRARKKPKAEPPADDRQAASQGTLF